MKKLLFLFCIGLLTTALPSCSKDVDNDTASEACERDRTGTVTISNSSNNPYNIYINGTFRLQLGGGGISSPITISEGNGVTLRAEQVSGFIFTPTIVNSTANVLRCSNYAWQIP